MKQIIYETNNKEFNQLYDAMMALQILKNIGGNCVINTSFLYYKFKDIMPLKMVNGFVVNGIKDRGSISPVILFHCWLEYDGFIIDPSVESLLMNKKSVIKTMYYDNVSSFFKHPLIKYSYTFNNKKKAVIEVIEFKESLNNAYNSLETFKAHNVEIDIQLYAFLSRDNFNMSSKLTITELE